MEGYRKTPAFAARQGRSVTLTQERNSNVVKLRFSPTDLCKVEPCRGWYHAAAIEEEQGRPRKG